MPILDIGTLTLILRYGIPGLYGITSIGYIYQFIQPTKKIYPWVRITLVTGVCLHTLLFILLFVRRGTIPLFTVFEGLFLCSLMLTILYIFMERVVHETCYGAFLLPMNFLMSLIAAIYLTTGKPLPDAMTSPYFVFHTILLITAYACFLLSCIIAIMYLLQHNEIKSRQLGYLFKRLPALEHMDISIARIDSMGLGFFFMGLVIGFLWLDYSPDSVYRMNLKISFSVITAAIYLVEHLFRIVKGWKGKRTALISISGFIFILITLLIGRHGY